MNKIKKNYFKDSKYKALESEEEFIMSPKVDSAFKLIFGDEKNKDVLIAFLSTALKLPKEHCFTGVKRTIVKLPQVIHMIS